MPIGFISELVDAFNSANFNAATAVNGIVYIATSEPRLRSYDMNTLLQGVSSTTAPANTPSGVAIGTLATGASATAVVVSSTNNQYDLINTATGVRTQITTNAVPTRYSANNQQVAAVPSLGVACVTQTASGGVRLINIGAGTAALQTISGMAGEAPTCVITRSPSSTFILGSSNSIVREITTNGVVINLVALPPLLLFNSTPQPQAITGLAAYNQYVVAATDRGMMYCIDWDTGQITDAMLCPQSTNSTCLSNSLNGVFILPSGTTPNVSGSTLTEIWFGTGKFITQDIFIGEGSFINFAAVIDAQTSRILEFNTTNNTVKARLFSLTSTEKKLVDTRIQYPLGTDISGRIVRIRDAGVGSAKVELDATIPSSLTSLTATEDHNYIEIALTLSPSGWDVREFKT